jgi:carbonic anhydrase
MTQQDVLDRLKDGNKRFVNDEMTNDLQFDAKRKDLIGGQHPYAIILSCADSRVVPELTFDTGLGELFVVRVAGNIANSSSIASIEYAVANLGSSIIVVLGHQSCGAITAAVNGGDNGYNLNHLVAHITPALAASGIAASITDVIKKNAELTARDLSMRSPIISKAVSEGKVQIVPAYYNLDTGVVDFL